MLHKINSNCIPTDISPEVFTSLTSHNDCCLPAHLAAIQAVCYKRNYACFMAAATNENCY